MPLGARAKLAVHDTSKFYAMANADLLWDIHAMQPDPDRFVKIKAHRNFKDIDNLLDLYHALGNHLADEAAKTACGNLTPDWKKELDLCSPLRQNPINLKINLFVKKM